MGRSKGNVPIRRCISCGKRRVKQELLRLVVNEKGELRPDTSGMIQCRGAYICIEKTCMDKLNGKMQLEKIFRSNEPISLSIDLVSFINNTLERGDKT